MCTYQEEKKKKEMKETKKRYRLTLKVNTLTYTCTFITIQLPGNLGYSHLSLFVDKRKKQKNTCLVSLLP